MEYLIWLCIQNTKLRVWHSAGARCLFVEGMKVNDWMMWSKDVSWNLRESIMPFASIVITAYFLIYYIQTWGGSFSQQEIWGRTTHYWMVLWSPTLWDIRGEGDSVQPNKGHWRCMLIFNFQVWGASPSIKKQLSPWSVWPSWLEPRPEYRKVG